MEGAGFLTLAGLVLILPFVLLKHLVIGPYRLAMSLKNNHSTKGPREQALAEASCGAAMIVFPVLLLLRACCNPARMVALGGGAGDDLGRLLALQRRKIFGRLA